MVVYYLYKYIMGSLEPPSRALDMYNTSNRRKMLQIMHEIISSFYLLTLA